MASKPITAVQRQTLAPLVAAAVASLKPHTEIAKELDISERQVRSLIKSSEVQACIDELQEYSKKQARAHIAQRGKSLMLKATKALEAALDKGNVEGIKLVFKALGILDEEKTEVGDTQINVIMPGSSGRTEGKVIDADHEKLPD